MSRWPTFLQPGDAIGLVLPASAVEQDRLDAVVQWVKHKGFRPVLSSAMIGGDSPYYAQSDDVRESGLMTMLTDPSIRAVWAVKGGYGSMRLLARLAQLPKPREPKLVIGYSDLTALLSFLVERWGWVAMHGVVLSQCVKGALDESVEPDILRAIAAETSRWELPLAPANATARALAKPVEGISKGGCLSLVTALLGTPFCVNTKNAVLFLEDVEEPGYRLDRMFTQLRLSGQLQKVRAVILGSFNGYRTLEKEEAHAITYALNSFSQNLDEKKIPVFSSPNFGHTREMRAFPMGANVRISEGMVSCVRAP